jgi:hypothetical protein
MMHIQKVKSNKFKLTSLRVVVIVAFAFSLSTVTAQTSVNVAGGNASGSSGSISYSLGQVVYNTSTGTNGSVAEGVQQPYEISIVTEIEAAKDINLSISAYPNPTTDFLQLNVDALDHLNLKTMSFHLYDSQGRLLKSEELTESKTQINMKNFVSSTYFVRVHMGNQVVKEFKIVKH